MIYSLADALKHRQRLALLLAILCSAGVLALWGIFVFTPSGQLMDSAALEGGRIGSHYVSAQARPVLKVVSLRAAATMVLIILLLGLVLRSHRRALWAVVAVCGANVSTQVLKYMILWRPNYGISERFDNANTLPSGHTTMAASAAVALVLLSGPRWRALAAWVGAAMAVAMGYSTLAMQWHRPSDVLAAILVPVAWGAIAVLGGAWSDDDHWDLRPTKDPDAGASAASEAASAQTQSAQAQSERADWHRPWQWVCNLWLALAGVFCLLIAALIVLGVWYQSGELLTRWGYFAAYMTGSVSTVGVACLAMSGLAALTLWPARPRRVKAGPTASSLAPSDSVSDAGTDPDPHPDSGPH